MTTTQTSNFLPVIIVGGGLVGGLCALLLAQGGIDVLMLDAAFPLKPELLQQRDARVLALSPASLSLLKRVGVLEKISRQMPYFGMQVWHADAQGQLDFGPIHQSPHARQLDTATLSALYAPLGSMIEPSVLLSAIQQTLAESSVRVQYGIMVQDIEDYGDQWFLRLNDGQCLHTALLIGADGARSRVRQAAHIDVDTLDYHQVALSCAIQTEKPHQHIARQVFLSGGPLAFLPMADSVDAMARANPSGHWQSVVWTVPEQWADELIALNDADFKQRLAQASGFMLGDILSIQSRAAFPLKALQAQRYTKPHLALIGDAAHVIHPLAGQGVNLGLLDAAVLVDCLLHDQARGLWAHEQTLGRYARTRRLPNSVMMHSMSAIGWLQQEHLVGLGGDWLGLVRSEILHKIAQMPRILDIFTKQASGRSALADTQYHF